MDMLLKLLRLSRDFLLITDSAGNCLKIGDHFQNVLAKHNVGTDDLSNIVRRVVPALQQTGISPPPLEKFGIYSSSFTLIQKTREQLVLFAEDQTANDVQYPFNNNTSQSGHLLKEKDKRIHTLLDESSDPIFSFKEDGTYLYVNQIFAQTLGYNQEEIIGKTVWDVFPQDEADKRFSMVRKGFLTGKTENIEVMIPLADGDKYFLTTVKPIKNEHEEVAFVICISKDITELREAQSQLKSLRGILPICSKCKKIRNDEGAWQQLEYYISNHSEAEFSHGMCPDCAEILYPDLFDKI
jgi:PAS domain S-box-containing protein